MGATMTENSHLMRLKDSCDLCPVPGCKRLPIPYHFKCTITGDQLIGLKCERHPAYTACGSTFGAAIQNFNRLASFIRRDAVEHAAEHPSKDPMTSICIRCQKDTLSIIHKDKTRQWVECAECTFPKYENAA